MASINASIVDEWLEDDKLMLIEAWSRDGYTKQDIANNIGIHLTTLLKWEKRYPEFKEAMKRGKEIIDYKVENALLKRALGYTTTEIKVAVGKQIKGGKTFQISKETTIKDIAPDVTACAIWLNNRLPDKWKRNRDKVVELEDEDNNLQITIERGPKKQSEDDSTNAAVKVQAKGNKAQDDMNNDTKGDSLKSEDDRDYWPDDWEDEDE